MNSKRILLILAFSLNSLPCFSQALPPKPTSSERYQSLETFAKAVFYIESMYVDPKQVSLPNVIDNALEGIVNKLDPHTVHLSKHAFEQLTADTKGQIGGVGIIVKAEKNKLLIISPIDNKPAMKKGIKAGDEITAINDISVEKIGTDVLDLMRGEPGTTLKLTIRRKGMDKPLEFSLIREVIQVSSVSPEVLGDGLLYARITNFQENTAFDLQNFLTAQKGNIKGFILDLRNNPGGLLEEAVRVVDLFIDSGLIVSTVGRLHDKVEREFAHKQNTFSGFPLIALINEGSASAAEIVAGALQDHQRGLIMGTPSFGKGSVQTLIALPDGSGLKLTIATYYTPNDRSIQAKGIQPDILLPKQPEATAQTPESRKEANLRGHLTTDDLSDFAKKSNLLSDVQSWQAYLSEDYQVVTAFTYLKGWNVFNSKLKGGKVETPQSNIR